MCIRDRILVNALRELGAEIEYVHHEGYPPLCIKGAELKGNEITSVSYTHLDVYKRQTYSIAGRIWYTYSF